MNWETLITDPAPWVPAGKEADTANFPNAREDDLNKIIEEETAEDFNAVQQASMTLRFNGRPLIEQADPCAQTMNMDKSAKNLAI